MEQEGLGFDVITKDLVSNFGISNVLAIDMPSQIHTLLSQVPIGSFILINISWLPLPSLDRCVEASMIPQPLHCVPCGPYGSSSPWCGWLAECGELNAWSSLFKPGFQMLPPGMCEPGTLLRCPQASFLLSQCKNNLLCLQLL